MVILEEMHSEGGMKWSKSGEEGENTEKTDMLLSLGSNKGALSSLSVTDRAQTLVSFV